jgi:uncharacterized membrane protein
MSNNKSVKILLPSLGIVFGAGVGMIASMLYSFHIALGMISGAAVGLLIGIIVPMQYGLRSRVKGRG